MLFSGDNVYVLNELGFIGSLEWVTTHGVFTTPELAQQAVLIMTGEDAAWDVFPSRRVARFKDVEFTIDRHRLDVLG